MTACTICQKAEPADTWTCCQPCLNHLDDNLARIVELTRYAADALVRETKGSSNGTRSIPGSRPPLDVAALDDAMGNDLLPILEDWEKLVREHFGLTRYGPASLARNSSVPPARLSTGGPGDASTSRGPDTADKER